VLAVSAVRQWAPIVPDKMVAPAQARMVIVPYTVILDETVSNAQGRPVAAPSQTWAVRSDGAVAVKIGDGEKGSRQIRLSSGLQVEVIDAVQAKSTTLRPIADLGIPDPNQNCLPTTGGKSKAGERLAAVERLDGYRVARITAGSTTRWLALDHGCAIVRRIIDFGEQGSSRLELVSLIPGEPSESLFLVPANYRETAPSGLGPAPSAKCDAACEEARRAHFERLDATYFKYRVP
jgi:hypothetical protein